MISTTVEPTLHNVREYNRAAHHQRIVEPVQTFASCDRWHSARPAANIKNNRPLDPRDEKVCTLSDSDLLNSSESVEDYCSMTSINCTQRNQLHCITILYSVSQKNHPCGFL